MNQEPVPDPVPNAPFPTQLTLANWKQFLIPSGSGKIISIRADDICRNYHRGNKESVAANTETAKAQDRHRIIVAIDRAGADGLTCDELEILLKMRHQTCSARCSELLRDGVIIRKPDPLHPTRYLRRLTRTGCNAAVLILQP